MSFDHNSTLLVIWNIFSNTLYQYILIIAYLGEFLVKTKNLSILIY